CKSGVNHLLNYISHRKQKSPDNLKFWNIVVVQPKANRAEVEVNITGVNSLKLINRSMFQELLNGDEDIKALMSKSDIKIDLDYCPVEKEGWGEIKSLRQESNCDFPLLILYPIDKDSIPAAR